MNNETQVFDGAAFNNEAESDVEQRLAEINAAMAGTAIDMSNVPTDSVGFACPIDPAEREQCEACQ